MQLTKDELVKFKAWRNQRRKFWAEILVWVVWAGSSIVIFRLLGDLIPEEAISPWILYASLSVLFFIIAGMVCGVWSTIRRAKKEKDGKTQDRKGTEEEAEK